MNSSYVAKILLIDSNDDRRSNLGQILEDRGHAVVAVTSCNEAIEFFAGDRPDLAILDMDESGIEAAKCIRSTSKEDYTPIMFITDGDSEASLQRCIDVGCDDFLCKPYSPTILSTKVDSLLRAKRLYRDQWEQNAKLLEYRQMISQEQEVAATLYKNFIHAGFLNTPELKYLMSPMALFNGDILLTAKTPGNNLYLLLGDFTGHGLSASIGAGPAAEIFYGMTEKGFGINEIIVEINQKMMKLLPVNMFLAATIFALHTDSKTLSYITCGLPDHYLHDRATGELRRIRSKNLPLGIIETLNPLEKSIEIDSNDYLYLFTDGVIEAHDRHGKQFGDAGVFDCLKPGLSGFEAIRNALHAHMKGLAQQDDITLVELHCNVDDPAWTHAGGLQKNVEIEPLPWKSSMEFHITALRQVNPVPLMVNALMEIQGFKAHRESIFMIVSELFANALDHGLLKLESSLKKSPEGFMRFYELRQERLNRFDQGVLSIAFAHRPTENGGELTIEVEDSGAGFNVDKIFTALDNNQMAFGRGIDLVRRLCREVEYFGNGNRVKAVYEWTL